MSVQLTPEYRQSTYEERNHPRRPAPLAAIWRGTRCQVDTMPEVYAEVRLGRIRHDAPREVVVSCSWRDGCIRLSGSHLWQQARARAEDAVRDWIRLMEAEG